MRAGLRFQAAFADGLFRYSQSADNPFAKRTSHGPKTLNTYRALTPLSWALVVVFIIYYSIRIPYDVPHGTTVGKQTDLNPTPFTQSKIVTGIYWYKPPLVPVPFVCLSCSTHSWANDVVGLSCLSRNWATSGNCGPPTQRSARQPPTSLHTTF